MLLIGSGEEYGPVHCCPVGEDTPLHPGNVYAATKACQGMLGEIYAKAYGMDLLCVRAFNHVGPGQAPMFVVSDFCRQTAAIELGQQEPVIRIGNLSAKRDFTDVRDVVRAYVLLAEKGIAGRVYNVGSGKAVEIRGILDLILAQSGAKIQAETDPAKLRRWMYRWWRRISAGCRRIRAGSGKSLWSRPSGTPLPIGEQNWRNKKQPGSRRFPAVLTTARFYATVRWGKHVERIRKP